jgi:hypothetical protein
LSLVRRASARHVRNGIDRTETAAYLDKVNKSITDRSTYGLAAGAMMLLAAAGLGELESTALSDVPAIDSLAAESMPMDPEYPDARALVLAVATLLAKQ